MIKIINETGRANDTKIIDLKTGHEIKGVFAIEIIPFKVNGFVEAKLSFRAELDIVAEVKP